MLRYISIYFKSVWKENKYIKEMQFDEKKAKELQKRYDLKPAIINKWRYNGRIPDKYKTDPRILERENERLKKVLSNEKLNKTSIALYAGLPRQTIVKFVTGDITLHEQNIIKLKAVLSEVKIELKKIVTALERTSLLRASERDIITFLDRKYIHLKLTVTPEIAAKISKWKNGKREFPVEDKNEILTALLILLAEI